MPDGHCRTDRRYQRTARRNRGRSRESLAPGRAERGQDEPRIRLCWRIVAQRVRWGRDRQRRQRFRAPDHRSTRRAGRALGPEQVNRHQHRAAGRPQGCRYYQRHGPRRRRCRRQQAVGQHRQERRAVRRGRHHRPRAAGSPEAARGRLCRHRRPADARRVRRRGGRQVVGQPCPAALRRR